MFTVTYASVMLVSALSTQEVAAVSTTRVSYLLFQFFKCACFRLMGFVLTSTPQKQIKQCVVSGFRFGVNEFLYLPSCFASLIDSWRRFGTAYLAR